MHLAQGMTTIRNRKYKPKMTNANIAKWQAGLIVHNKQCKRLSEPKLNFEQYVDYCHGISPKKDIRADRSVFKVEKSIAQQQMEDYNIKYPSAPMSPTGSHNCSKKETMKYTGDLITGIATMHKSNAVPVMKGTNHAIDIARMGR
jgi:hypothetical protein